MRKLLVVIMVFALCGCSKERRRHGVKGRIIDRSTQQPLGNVYVKIGYYTPSSGMGFLTLNGIMNEGRTDYDGYFDIRFHVKEYHLREGMFTISTIVNNAVDRIGEVPHESYAEHRIIDVGNLYVP